MNWWVLRRQVAVSWMIATLALGVTVGVIVLQYVPLGFFGSVLWCAAAVGAAVIVFWRKKLYILPLLFIAGMLFGLWRGSPMAIDRAAYAQLAGYNVRVSGYISEDPDLDKNNATVLRLEAQEIEGRSLGGKIWVTTQGSKELKRGDLLTVEGKLSEGFGNFSASMYRATLVKAQRPVPGDIAGQVRDWFASRVKSAIPDPEASLGIGYLLGQRRALPPDLDEALKVAGLTHIVVASGYNLTILVRFARRAFVKVSKYLATLTAGGMIAAFVAITGMSPSMSRAGLVAGLSLAAWYYGRKFHPLVLLSFAAGVTLAINPSFGWNDLGWQLSFAAFAGVMVMAPLLQAYFFGPKKPGTLRQILGETIAAQLATLPIIVLAFAQFSNVALLANFLVLPLVPLAMLLTFLAGVFGGVVGEIAGLLLSYMVGVAKETAALPWAQSEVSIPVWLAVAAYGLMAVAVWWMWRKTKVDLRDNNIVE